MAAGDVLLFFSDGLTETIDAGGREFSQERLQRFVLDHADKQPQVIYSQLVRTVAQHRAGNAQLDDITVLIIKINQDT